MLLAGRYRLVGQLGRGGMGTVWRARDEVLGREVAVKEVMLPAVGEQARDDLIERTRREARLAARLNHPNVVTVFDVVEEDGRPWLVMELVPSRSLTEVLESEGPLTTARAATLGLQLLDALDAAHRAGILHRDVKPGNVLVTADGRVVLSDFGIARLEGDPALTGTGLIMGSPAYMAPERARGHAVGPASDLWSLGATLYTAVEGRAPFSRDGALPTLTAVVTDSPDPFRLAGPFAPLLIRLLDRDPEARPGSAEARAELRKLAASPAPAAPPAAVTEPLREVQRTRALPAAAPETPALSPETPLLKTPLLKTPSPLTGPPRTPPPPVPRRTPDRPRVPRRVLAAVALVAVAGVLAWVVQRPDDTTRTAAGPSPSASRSAAATAASPRPEPEPTPAPSEQGDGRAVPAGYEWHDDPTGFGLAIPRGWNVRRDGPGGRFVYFEDPDSDRYLLVDQTDDPKGDPKADWERQEAARAPRMRDYDRIRIETVDYFERAADWEWTYTHADYGPVHVVNRGFVTSADRGYALYWLVPADEWNGSDDELAVFRETFRPGGGDAG
jgi:serine/threonine protein kinase